MDLNQIIQHVNDGFKADPGQGESKISCYQAIKEISERKGLPCNSFTEIADNETLSRVELLLHNN